MSQPWTPPGYDYSSYLYSQHPQSLEQPIQSHPDPQWPTPDVPPSRLHPSFPESADILAVSHTAPYYLPSTWAQPLVGSASTSHSAQAYNDLSIQRGRDRSQSAPTTLLSSSMQGGKSPPPPLPPKIPLPSLPHSHPKVKPQPALPPPRPPSHHTPHALPSLPPLPPKPPSQMSWAGSDLQHVGTSVEPTFSPVFREEDELALALQLSAKESQEQRGKLVEQEEEDLARAMRESLVQNRISRSRLTLHITNMNDDSIPLQDVDSPKFVTGALSDSPQFLPSSSTKSEPWNKQSQHVNDAYPASMRSRAFQNEVSSHRLVEEDVAYSTPSSDSLFSSTSYKTHFSPLLTKPEISPSSFYYQPSVFNAITAANGNVVSKVSSISSASSYTSTSPEGSSSDLPPVYSDQAANFFHDEQYKLNNTSLTSVSEGGTPAAATSRLSSDSLTCSDQNELFGALPLEPSQLLDNALLTGISFGFASPQIIAIPTVMRGSIPHVISLPDGNSPPFHIQAPNWRHMLKLLARLSGTRIEASVEAMATSKADFKLRTVIQFVKVHHSSADWRMVLYLTIDNSPPVSNRSVTGDVHALPTSYGFVPLPALLQDGMDSTLSKVYTVPATSTTPYPSLPISLPNMAMYLTSAMEDSRRAVHDGSGGIRRLARLVKSLYGKEQEAELGEQAERRGVRGVFRQVFGRPENVRRNTDTWYLVTPFVPE